MTNSISLLSFFAQLIPQVFTFKRKCNATAGFKDKRSESALSDSLCLDHDVRYNFTFLDHLADSFCPKWLTVIHTFMQINQEQFGGSGALWRAEQGNQTANLPITRRWLYPWATAKTYLRLKSINLTNRNGSLCLSILSILFFHL